MIEMSQVKEVIAKRQIVEVDGIYYWPYCYRLWLDETGRRWGHSMELKSTNGANSITVAPLSHINIVEGKVFKDGRIQEVK